MLPLINCRNARSEDSESQTLFSALHNKVGIIDFWHTKCVKCPAALEKFNKDAQNFPDCAFVSCALSQGADDYELVNELTSE